MDAPALVPDWNGRGLTCTWYACMSDLHHWGADHYNESENGMSNSTLDDFVKADKRKTCVVCQLAPNIRKQIVERKDGVNLVQVASWLKSLGHRVSEAQLTAHLRGAHSRGK